MNNFIYQIVTHLFHNSFHTIVQKSRTLLELLQLFKGLSKLMCNISYNISHIREKVKIHMSITYKLLYQVFKYHDKD